MKQPDFEKLLLCLQEDRNSEENRKLRQVSIEDWREILKPGQQFGLAPLLYFRLKQGGLILPDDVSETLRNAYLRNTGRNIGLFAHLGEMLAGLQGEGIPVIVLKGGYLAEAVYDEIGLRVMADLDLLVPVGEVSRAIGTLEGLGYKSLRPYIDTVDGELHFHAPPMEKNGTVVELHWKLTLEHYMASVRMDDLWSRAQTFEIDGIIAHTLGISDMILHLGVHAAYGHQFINQLHSMVDLDVILHKFKDRVDWAEAIQICREWKTERGIYLTLRLAVELMNSEIPEFVLAGLKPADWTENTLDWAKTILYKSSPSLSESFITVLHSNTPGERFKALVKGFFPSRGVMSMIYGYPPDSKEIMMLYPKHAITRISKYWGYAWKSMWGKEEQALESISGLRLREWLGIN